MPSAQRSASGSSAIAMSASDPLGQRQQQVGRAVLLRVRERHGREVAVRCGLLGHHVHVGEAGQMQCLDGGLTTDAVHRGDRHPDAGHRRRAIRPASRPGPGSACTQLVRPGRGPAVGVDAIGRAGRRRSPPRSRGPAGRPVGRPASRYTFSPLSCGGLCDAVTCRPAAAPSCRTANAVTGVGSGARRQQHREARRGKHSRRVGGELGGPVPAVVADDDLLARGVRSAIRCAAIPAAARRTTARFIPAGPARSGPRSPAVPKASGARIRSCRSATASGDTGHRLGQHPLQLGPVGRRRVVGDPADRGVAQRRRQACAVIGRCHGSRRRAVMRGRPTRRADHPSRRRRRARWPAPPRG